jgi:hypothetical protein
VKWITCTGIQQWTPLSTRATGNQAASSITSPRIGRRFPKNTLLDSRMGRHSINIQNGGHYHPLNAMRHLASMEGTNRTVHMSLAQSWKGHHFQCNRTLADPHLHKNWKMTSFSSIFKFYSILLNSLCNKKKCFCISE